MEEDETDPLNMYRFVEFPLQRFLSLYYYDNYARPVRVFMFKSEESISRNTVVWIFFQDIQSVNQK